MTNIFIIAILLFTLQSIGGFYQVKNYKKTVRKLHAQGNVGVGQRKSGFFSSYIIIVVADTNGVITGCETLDGIFIFSKFRAITKFKKIELINENIETVKGQLQEIDNKYYIGLTNAIDGLINKLNKQEV